MKANLVLAAVTIVFSAFFLIQAFQIPTSNTFNITGPTGWPIVILLFMGIMGVILFIKTLIEQKKSNQTADYQEREANSEEISNKVRYRHFFILGALAIYVILLPVVGFLVATPLLFFGLAKILELGNILKTIWVTIVSNLAIIGLFIFILSIPFPRGIGIFRSLSFLVY